MELVLPWGAKLLYPLKLLAWKPEKMTVLPTCPKCCPSWEILLFRLICIMGSLLPYPLYFSPQYWQNILFNSINKISKISKYLLRLQTSCVWIHSYIHEWLPAFQSLYTHTHTHKRYSHCILSQRFNHYKVSWLVGLQEAQESDIFPKLFSIPLCKVVQVI